MDKAKIQILLIDDDELILETVGIMFKTQTDYEFSFCKSGENALDILSKKQFDLIISDVRMPGMSGLDLLDKVRAKANETPIIMLSSYGDVELIVNAMQKGASDYLIKPIEKALLIHAINKALENRHLREEISQLRLQLKKMPPEHGIIGKSAAMKRIFEQIENIADTDTTVLIRGETGTGKELVAEAIHSCSVRKNKPLVKINCASLSETLLESELFGHEKGAFTSAIRKKLGKFEIADGGTIFLDEIGDITPRIQARLLRVLQEREFERVGGIEQIKVDVRIIAATNTDLEMAMERGIFRRDLYYRLNVFPIVVPPLRDRKEDIPLLAMHFLDIYNKKFGRNVNSISRPVLDRLISYSWQGNVRELENLMERAVIVCRGNTIRMEDVAPFGEPIKKFEECETASNQEVYRFTVNKNLSYREGKNALLKQYEREFLQTTLSQTGGSISRTSELMGISPRAVYEKMKLHNLNKADFKK